MLNQTKYSDLEKACIDFYYHNDSPEATKENLLELLSLAFSSDDLDNCDKFKRSGLLWTYKHLQKLITAVYKMPIEKTVHISQLRDIALKQTN